jgi:hypothetical protein
METKRGANQHRRQRNEQSYDSKWTFLENLVRAFGTVACFRTGGDLCLVY